MKVFLSVSYSGEVDFSGQVLPEYRAELEGIIAVFESRGHQVFCAPREEGWKINDTAPAEAFNNDMRHIDDCDLLIALVSNKISAGIQLELGYAHARGKRIILASQGPLGYINQGLVDAGHAKETTYSSATDLLEKLPPLLDN